VPRRVPQLRRQLQRLLGRTRADPLTHLMQKLKLSGRTGMTCATRSGKMLPRATTTLNDFGTVTVHESEIVVRVWIVSPGRSPIEPQGATAITTPTLAVPQENAKTHHCGHVPGSCGALIKLTGLSVVPTGTLSEIIHVASVVDAFDMAKGGAAQV
jgi:hypothetical protein